MAQEDCERILRLARERGDFVALEDGFYCYAPSSVGALRAHELRILADELDRMNAPHEAQIDRDFGLGGKYFGGPEVDFSAVTDDRSVETCRSKFSGTAHFPAEPQLPPVRSVTEERSVCAQIQPSGENARSMRLGGSRYMCSREYGHEGKHGEWMLVGQPEHAEALRTHKMKAVRFVR